MHSNIWAGHVEGLRKKSIAFRLLVGMPEEKGPLGRSRNR
jgi:hypothetical protein